MCLGSSRFDTPTPQRAFHSLNYTWLDCDDVYDDDDTQKKERFFFTLYRSDKKKRSNHNILAGDKFEWNEFFEKRKWIQQMSKLFHNNANQIRMM